MILPACPNGKCRCWCSPLAGEPQDFDSDTKPLPSGIAHLATSNDAPLDSDKQRCQSMLYDVQEELQTLDNHIESLERVISALKAVKEKKSTLACLHRSILNPVRSLPIEILSKIFRDACPSVEFKRCRVECSSLDTRQAPWTLLKVSTRWRQVALSDPQLWSTIAITGGNRCKIHSVNFLRVQLQLSHSAPLTIAIDWDQPPVLSSSLVEVLLPSSPRWETLRLSATKPDPDLVHQFGRIEGKLPALRNLYYDIPKSHSATTSIFAAAPKLRTLYVSGINYLPYLRGLPFSQITTFSTIHLTYTSSTHLPHLASFTALQRCSLLCKNLIPELDAIVPFILPNLRILQVGMGPDDDLTRVLGKLTLPALKVLTIERGRLYTCLSALLQRSQCILKELCFGPVYIQDITTVFEKSPSLEKLRVYDRFSCSLEVTIALTRRIDLLPSLQVLQVDYTLSYPDLYLLQFVKDARPWLEVVIQKWDPSMLVNGPFFLSFP